MDNIRGLGKNGTCFTHPVMFSKSIWTFIRSQSGKNEEKKIFEKNPFNVSDILQSRPKIRLLFDDGFSNEIDT